MKAIVFLVEHPGRPCDDGDWQWLSLTCLRSCMSCRGGGSVLVEESFVFGFLYITGFEHPSPNPIEEVSDRLPYVILSFRFYSLFIKNIGLFYSHFMFIIGFLLSFKSSNLFRYLFCISSCKISQFYCRNPYCSSSCTPSLKLIHFKVSPCVTSIVCLPSTRFQSLYLTANENLIFQRGWEREF